VPSPAELRGGGVRVAAARTRGGLRRLVHHVPDAVDRSRVEASAFAPRGLVTVLGAVLVALDVAVWWHARSAKP